MDCYGIHAALVLYDFSTYKKASPEYYMIRRHWEYYCTLVGFGEMIDLRFFSCEEERKISILPMIFFFFFCPNIIYTWRNSPLQKRALVGNLCRSIRFGDRYKSNIC